MKDELTKRRFEDLVEMAWKNNHYTFTSFLTEAELSEFYEIKHLSAENYTLYGGRENADRNCSDAAYQSGSGLQNGKKDSEEDERNGNGVSYC